ncbi:hypothetical protein D1AOALGA4SA_6056 [Olavius algarvensis Delta 1 endosymbiont]|nr:hypothetical protein D1AOALGA4SA_6056 [Olavius algarvensis Delta 1 endosymbiont]
MVSLRSIFSILIEHWTQSLSTDRIAYIFNFSICILHY